MTVRGTAVALVTAALVASAEITAAALALVATTTLVAVTLVAIELVAAVALATLAFKTLARRTALTCVLPPLRRWCGFRGSGCCIRVRRRAVTRFAEIGATAATMTLLALCPLAAFTGCSSAFSRAGVMTLAVAVVMRTAFLGTAAGPPDFDEYGFGRRVGLCFRGGGFGGWCFGSRRFSRYGLARSRLCGSFWRACCLGLHRLFGSRGFCNRLRCGFDGLRLRRSGGRFAERRDAG